MPASNTIPLHDRLPRRSDIGRKNVLARFLQQLGAYIMSARLLHFILFLVHIFSVASSARPYSRYAVAA
jgi:hypothetical protein